MQTLQVLDYVAIGVFLALTAAVGGSSAGLSRMFPAISRGVV